MWLHCIERVAMIESVDIIASSMALRIHCICFVLFFSQISAPSLIGSYRFSYFMGITPGYPQSVPCYSLFFSRNFTIIMKIWAKLAKYHTSICIGMGVAITHSE